MSDLKVWLDGLGLGSYFETLAKHDIDLSIAPELTDQDLEKIGLSLGHRRKFIAAAAKLAVQSQSSAAAAAEAPQHVEAAASVERRQVTVVFVDVVGSTELAGRVDPEDLLS